MAVNPPGSPEQREWPRRGVSLRPVAIPADIDARRATRTTGPVRLPHHVRWSGLDRTYDLADRADLISVYEQVLQEGTEDDVRALVDVDCLIELWDELVLPDHVRRAWADWLREHRHLELVC